MECCSYGIFDADGRMVKSVTLPECMLEKNIDPGCVAIAGEYSIGEVWLNGETVEQRPVLSVSLTSHVVPADGESAVAVSGVPSGATVLVGDALYVVDDGELVVTFDTPGEYVVSIRAFPYRDLDLTLTATEI